MDNKSNSARILEELVSLEAWHTPLVANRRSPFHVALAFGDVRYSGSQKAPIEFRVRLKRATLVVVCDENLSVPPTSKTRVYPPQSQLVRTLLSRGQGNENVSSSASSDGLGADLLKGPSANKKTDKQQSKKQTEGSEQQSELTETLTQRVKMTYRSVGQEHHWDCIPIHDVVLQGSAHEGTDSLMMLSPKVDKRLEDLGVRVYIKCKAEDFEISDIVVAKSISERLKGKEDLERRKRIAREVIKEKLAEAQLEIVDLDERFREAIIADILATPDAG